jgi:hypothetical protein
MTFIQQCVAGLARPNQINDYISYWHASRETIPIHQFLGMSWSEYSTWVENSNSLLFIIETHRRK